MAKYPIAIKDKEAGARLERLEPRNMGRAEGSIIATIMASHISKKLTADANQVWPCIRIHIMDMVQPPGMAMSQHIERQK